MNRKEISPVRKVEQEFAVLRPLMAVLVAMVLCFAIILISSKQPMEAIKLLLTCLLYTSASAVTAPTVNVPVLSAIPWVNTILMETAPSMKRWL